MPIGHDKEEVEKTFLYGKAIWVIATPKLSLIGKACMVKLLAIAKWIYDAPTMCLTEIDFKKKMQRLIFNFIWENQ